MNKIFHFKSVVLFLFLVTFIVTLYSKLSKSSLQKGPPASLEEKFDPTLLSVNSCDKLDSLILRKFQQSNYDTAGTVKFIDDFLRNRFYHSYSELNFEDNWIANLCGRWIWSDFLYPVSPCDIIKYPIAACSQQGILFQQQLDLLKIPCSTIKFFPLSAKTSGHYAVSVYYKNSWHYYDSNQEPLIVDSTMPSINVIVEKKLYEKMYVKKSNIRFQEFFKNKSYERVNKQPFSKGKMYYFQMFSQFLSYWGWSFFLLFYLFLIFKGRR